MSGALLDQLLARYQALPPGAREQVTRVAIDATAHMYFVPLPGPQTEAYLSRADVLLYGGQAGSGKTALLVGLASQEHSRSIIFRREAGQTDGLEEFGKKLIGNRASYNGSKFEWTFTSGRSVKLAGMKEPGDWNKHAGRERDFFGFDEGCEFLLEQVSSLLAWNRGPEGQRCRVVLASNPPRTSEGVWVIEWFAPWLDERFPQPAKPGELRYAAIVDGHPHWQPGPEPVMIDDEWRQPLSFTFIPAALSDNPYRNTAEYRAKLNSLPEPLRSQLLKGIFTLAAEDDLWQAIPTAWVQAAMDRWRPTPPTNVPMCAIGVDVAQGGADNTILAPRHDGWYAELTGVPGCETPGGTHVAGLVIAKRRHLAVIVIDIGGGWGGDAYGHLKQNGVDAVAYMGVKTSTRRTQDNQLQYFNVRSQAYWQFREALNPEQEGGSSIALPRDPVLLSDLCAPRFQVVRMGHGSGVKIEPKDDVVKRLGRSPDRGDAVVMAWQAGPKAVDSAALWSSEQGRRHHAPRVDSGPRHRNVNRRQ